MRALLLAASYLLLAALPSPAQEGLLAGHWEGVLRFRGDDLAVRLHFEPTDPARVTLDIPELLMAWEPIPATAEGPTVEIELPFGLGGLALRSEGDEVRARKPLAGDTLLLHLRRTGPPPFTREAVAFSSGGIELVGTVVVPEGEGPFPGVVLIHGSAPQGRESWPYRSWADLLARQGLAVLYYDKRGVGESGGEEGADLDVLAADAAAAVRVLRTRPEVDPGRVGLKGSSQGAWIAERVAADLGDVAFLLLVSASADTPREQEMRRVEHTMRAQGRPEEEIQDALAYLGLYFWVARTGEGWETLERAVGLARAEPWGEWVDQPRSPEDLGWWRRNHAFQPRTAVGSLDLPVLLLYGADDTITPPVENVGELRSLFASPGLVEAHVLPAADHRLEVESGRDAEGRWRWPRIAPGALEIVRGWLERTVEGIAGH